MSYISQGAPSSTHSRAASRWLALCLVPLLSACALVRDWTDPTTVSIRGVPPTLEQLNISSTAYSQNLMVDELIQTAGLDLPPGTQLPPDDNRWSLVMKAGVYEIGRQCDQYLDVLFRFNREQRAGRQDLAAAAAATGAIMGIAGASAKALAITAASFGLASSLFDASVNSVLFTIEPSALRNVALQGRQSYLAQLDPSKVKSRPDMLIALQGYLTQCSPAAIEANINNAASGAPSVSIPAEAGPAARLAAPGTVLLQQQPPIVLPPTPPLPAPEVPKAPVRPRVTEQKPVPAEYAAFLDASVQSGPAQLRQVFAALCVEPREIQDTTAAAKTTARIRAFQQQFNFVPQQPMPGGSGKLNQREIDSLKNQPKCETDRFENFFEIVNRRDRNNKPRDINSPNLINAMNEKIKTIDPQKQLAPNASIKDVRDRIPEVRKMVADQLVLKDDALSNQLTRDFVEALLGGK